MGVKLAKPIWHLPPKISQIGLFPPSYEPNDTHYELYNCNIGAKKNFKKLVKLFVFKGPPFA